MGDAVPQFLLGEEAGDVVDRVLFCRLGHRIDDDEPQCQVQVHHLEERQLGFGNLGGGVGGDGPADADALDHLRQVGAEFNVDHPVDRLTAIESFHAFAPTGLPVVEDLVCTN